MDDFEQGDVYLEQESHFSALYATLNTLQISMSGKSLGEFDECGASTFTISCDELVTFELSSWNFNNWATYRLTPDSSYEADFSTVCTI